jgi:predicted amidohydrolase YtcJ
MDYIPDGKSMAYTHIDGDMLGETEKVLEWGSGMSRFYPKQIKLFADGAMFSQLMQMKDGYLDGHHGEWIINHDLLERAVDTYWDAGYQIHVHQNGDEGLDVVLDIVEANLKRNPREDHRTVIVHFGFSTKEQVQRIKELGIIVSANSYYTVALADTYSEVGIGPERAQQMVRLGDLARAGVSFSLHADMPMAPGKPLFLMWSAVNRSTLNNNNIAGPEQRITPEQALRAVTIEAAYSMRLEKDYGSLEVGKFANITVLDDNPLTIDPMAIKDISIWGTIHEGRVLPAPY